MEDELDRFYSEATEPYKSQLKHFRQTHNLKVVTVGGIHWTYFTGGGGENVMLVLHGGGGLAESLFRYIMALEENYRVIAPTVPAGVSTVACALDGIRAVMDQEAVKSAHLFGVSNGGMIGQCLVRSDPQCVRSLILFHTMLPSQEYARLFGRRAKTLSLLPRWFTLAFGLRWLKQQIQAEAPIAKPGETAFWLAYFNELYQLDLLTREYFVSRARLLTDYFQTANFSPQEMEGWKGRIFIIESENDQVVNRKERERLKAFYQQAMVHTFRGSGHLGGGLFQVEETLALINDFIHSQAQQDHFLDKRLRFSKE